MGLDITSFEVCKKVEEPHNLKDDWCEDHAHYYINSLFLEDFPDSSIGLEGGACYTVDGEVFAFRAGSYSGHNFVRDEFCKAILGVPAGLVWADVASYRGKPLYELINFSDCEGFISGKVAAKLAKDFEENREKAEEAFKGENIWLLDRWDSWTQAFQLAAPNGLVVFH